jgi:RNA polymerase sigma factor for flagellar operon FliA
MPQTTASQTSTMDATADAARRAKTRRLTALWKRFKKAGEESVRNELVEHYLYLVKVISNRIAARLPRSIDIQDLRSAGIFGLMRAVENYDLTRGTPFESYCATRVRGAILDELRSQDWVPRLVRNRASMFHAAVTALKKELGREPSVHEIGARLEMPPAEAEVLAREANLTSVFTLGPQDERDDDPRVLRRLDVLMDKDSEVPFEKLVAQDLAGSLGKVLGQNERTVVALYYHENLTMREIGTVLGISESRVCQIHTKTLQKLKAHLDSIGVRGLEEMPEPLNPDARD